MLSFSRRLRGRMDCAPQSFRRPICAPLGRPKQARLHAERLARGAPPDVHLRRLLDDSVALVLTMRAPS